MRTDQKIQTFIFYFDWQIILVCKLIGIQQLSARINNF
jgi:hypothetical protein